MATYPFTQGIDYGTRTRGTLGLGFHMTEGNGTISDVQYLARRSGETVTQWHTRVRGVSAHVVITNDGIVHQMVDFSHAAGSFNPDDRNPATTGYYNGNVIRAVLGASYFDPNACTIVAEIAGKRADGPNAKQVAAAVAWALDMRRRFPTIRGAFGHADQTDTKGCPGLTANMKSIFSGVGGHGLFSSEVPMLAVTSEIPIEVTVADGAAWFDLDGRTVLTHGSQALTWRVSPFACGTFRAIYATIGGKRRAVLIKPNGTRPLPAPPAPDCTTEVKTAVDEFASKVVIAIAAVPRP